MKDIRDLPANKEYLNKVQANVLNKMASLLNDKPLQENDL